MLTASAPTVDAVESLVGAATRAPSVHNTQPWQWRYDGGVVALYADRSRQVRSQDTDGRDLVISCGAALHHFRIAARHAGWDTLVRRLPDPSRRDLLAEVRLQPFPEEARPPAAAIYRAIFDRRSDRRHHASAPLSMSYLDFLTETATRQGAMAVSLDSLSAQRHLADMLLFARVIQDADAEGRAEMEQWMGGHPHDGVPAANRLRTKGRLSDQDPPVTRFPSGTLPDPGPLGRETHVHWLAIGTSSDDTLSRLRAGEAASAVLLQATADGMATVPLSQAVEVASTRLRLEEQLFAGAQCLQIVIQVSRPEDGVDPIPASPRRPLDEVFRAGR